MRHYSPVLAIVLIIVRCAASQDKLKTDAFGDALPRGALQRIGTTRWRIPETSDPTNMRLSPDARRLGTLNVDGTIDIWRLPEWTFCRLLLPRPSERDAKLRFQAFRFTHDGTSVAAADSAHRLLLFQLATGKCTNEISLPAEFSLIGEFITVSHDRQTLVCSGHRDGTHETLVWSLADNKLKRSIRIPATTSVGNAVVIPAGATCPSPRFAPLPANPLAMHIISPDCCWFAMSKMKDRNKEGNNVLEIWDCSTGKTARKIAMESPLEQIVFSQDAKWLLVAIQGEPTVRMYEVATGKECYNLHLWYKGIGHMAFAPDSQSFYVGDASQGKISRWKTATGELMANYASPLDYAVQQLGFARPDEPVALAQVGHIVHAWEVTTGKIISATNVFRQPIVAVHFSQQGELFIGGEQGQASWWNPETGRKTRDLKLEIAARASINYRLGMAVHGEFLVHFDACPRSEREAGISEFKSGKFLYSEESQWALTLSLFANGQKAASLQRKTVRLWNTREGDDYAKFDLPLTESFHQAHMSVSESGRFFAVATDGNEGGDVLLFDHEKRTILRTWQIEASNTRMLRFSLDNRWLVFSEANDALRLSRLGQNLSGTLLKLPGSEITQCVAFSPEGRQLACATVDGTSPQQPGRIVIYELASKKVRREFLGHKTGIIHCLAYSPDAGLLASGASDTTAMVWQAGLRSTPKTDKTFAGKELATAFTQMAGDDAKLAFEAMMRLVQTPRQTIALLTQHIPPAAKADLQGRSVAEWIGDLGSEQYAVRIKAAALLFSIGPAVDADLRAALARPKNLETKRRLEDLLARLAARELTTQEILHVRAVELAEAIASKQARALLTRWTTGEPGATLTDEARLALARMPQ